MNGLIKKIKLIEQYFNECSNPTYRDFLLYAKIDGKDFTKLYQEITLENKKAIKCYYALEEIKHRFEIMLEKQLIYQENKNGYNYKILREIYQDSINSSIALNFRDVRTASLFASTRETSKKLELPNNTSEVKIWQK